MLSSCSSVVCIFAPSSSPYIQTFLACPLRVQVKKGLGEGKRVKIVAVESRDNVCIRREKKKKLLVVFASLFCLSRSRRSPDRLLKEASVVSLVSLVN